MDLSDLDGTYGCQRVLKGEIVPKSLRSVYFEFNQELEVMVILMLAAVL